MGNNYQIERAQSALWHYFVLLARASGVTLDCDCKSEIYDIVDSIVEGCLREVHNGQE